MGLPFSWFYLLSVFLFAALLPHLSHSQKPQNISSLNGYSCPFNLTRNPCQTMVFYRAQNPSYGNLSAISDLFSVSVLSIKQASNLSPDTSSLVDGQKLLIPINCDCMGNLSQANITYQFVSGDTFYIVSTFNFQNLTTYQAVEVANPTRIPTQIEIGDRIVFPIRCRCPTTSQLQKGLNYLITYAVSGGDTLDSIAATFNSTARDIVSVNAGDLKSKSGVVQLVPFDTILVPVSRFPVFSQPAPKRSPPPKPPVAPTQASSSSKGYKLAVILLAVCLGISVLLLLVFVLLFWVLSRKGEGSKRMGFSSYEENGQIYQSVDTGPKSSFANKDLLADISQCLDKYNLYSLQLLRNATNDFNPNSIIQGHVYKAVIGDEVFAVKKMKSDVTEELRILQKVNHSNLVRLDGFCIDPKEGECYLVYEYVENGSLYSWFESGMQLSWKTRVQIAVDVANGLNYIHEHTQPSVVHKDIKSSNILLDTNMRAKIANFGLAKSGCNAITRHIVGTQGYMAPEYLMDGVVTTKMDVFAFGVVLLELVSGWHAVGEGGKLLWMEMETIVDDGESDREDTTVRRWMDVRLIEDSNCSTESVMSVLSIARTCIEKDASQRPSMGDVVYMLSKIEQLRFNVPMDELVVSSSVGAR